MATFERFEDIDAWKRARELTRGVYRVTGAGPFTKDWALRDQVRRASVSVMGNIAEGFERGGTREFIQFLATAKGSVAEVKSHMYVATDQRYVSDEQHARLADMADEIARMIGGLVAYLRRTPIRGSKYRR